MQRILEAVADTVTLPRSHDNQKPRIEGRVRCVIPETHLRGITLDQLKRLFIFALGRCKPDHWKTVRNHFRTSRSSKADSDESSSRPVSRADCPPPPATTMKRSWSRQSPAAKVDANPADFDLYTLVDVVIKPVTKKRDCSYVEFTSEDPAKQVPCWFVSHYWGEPVKDFISCLELFHERHALGYETPFWICAYALRQHQLSVELGTGDPMEEPFAKALASPNVQGTAVVLDEKLTIYRRAWCCFETVLTILLNKRLDLVVTCANMPYMIADGPAKGDGDTAVQEARDQDFPLDVAEKGMEVTIELSTTSLIADKNRILNAISTSNVSNEAPPLFHPNYDVHNAEIRKKFAAVMLRVATANGDADGVRRALHRSPGAQHVWRNADDQTVQEVAEVLAQRFPDDQERRDIVAYFKQAGKQKLEALDSKCKGERSEGGMLRRLNSGGSSGATPVPNLRRSSRRSNTAKSRSSLFDQQPVLLAAQSFPAGNGGRSRQCSMRRRSLRKSVCSEMSVVSYTSDRSGGSWTSEASKGDDASQAPGTSRSKRPSAMGAVRAVFTRHRRPRNPAGRIHYEPARITITKTPDPPPGRSWSATMREMFVRKRFGTEGNEVRDPVLPAPRPDDDADTPPAPSDNDPTTSMTTIGSSVSRYIDMPPIRPPPRRSSQRTSSCNSNTSSVARWILANIGHGPGPAVAAVTPDSDSSSSGSEVEDVVASVGHVRSAAAERAGDAHRILQWMKGNSRTAEVQQEGCRALGELVVLPWGIGGGAGSAGAPDTLVAEAIAEALAAAMQSHRKVWNVQVEACRAVWALASRNEECRQRARAAGLVESLTATLRAYGKHKRVWVEATLAYGALCPVSDREHAPAERQCEITPAGEPPPLLFADTQPPLFSGDDAAGRYDAAGSRCSRVNSEQTPSDFSELSDGELPPIANEHLAPVVNEHQGLSNPRLSNPRLSNPRSSNRASTVGNRRVSVCIERYLANAAALSAGLPRAQVGAAEVTRTDSGFSSLDFSPAESQRSEALNQREADRTATWQAGSAPAGRRRGGSVTDIGDFEAEAAALLFSTDTKTAAGELGGARLDAARLDAPRVSDFSGPDSGGDASGPSCPGARRSGCRAVTVPARPRPPASPVPRAWQP